MARYALVIGIAKYKNFSNLPNPAKDAEAIARLLEKHGNFQEVKRLPANWIEEERRWEVTPNGQLTGDELSEELNKFLLEQAKDNEALIYFAGHGLEVPSRLGRNKQKGYQATSDCSRDGSKGIPLDELNDLICESQLSNLVMLLDCCHAGYALERKLLDDSLTAFGKKTDYYLITACRGFEKALEAKEHGVFTEAVLRGLGDENADEDGRVSGDRLFDFIASELKGSGQEPIRMGWGRSITLVQYPPKQKIKVVKELEIVTTMRADFLEYCLSYESLTELIQNQAVYMPPLLGAELEEAIVKPANLQGYHLETGLLGAILDEVGKEKDCLPLLQFALTELWEKAARVLDLLATKPLESLILAIQAHQRHSELR